MAPYIIETVRNVRHERITALCRRVLAAKSITQDDRFQIISMLRELEAQSTLLLVSARQSALWLSIFWNNDAVRDDIAAIDGMADGLGEEMERFARTLGANGTTYEAFAALIPEGPNE